MRSFLFIPGDDEKKLGKGLASGADALILDLEDAVSAARKADARKLTAQYVTETRSHGNRPRLYVRINALDTPLWEDDLAGVIAARPDGIFLPKPRSGEDVHKLSIALHHAEERTGAAKGETRIIAIATEVASSVLNLRSYVDASTRLEGLTWGAEDLSATVGARTTRGADGRAWRSPYRLARDLCLITATAAHVQPIDTVYVNFRDLEGLRAEAHEAASDGFTGKMAIHPNQVEAINELFTPTPEEIARSEEIVEAFAANPEAGVIAIRGQMVDKAHIALAERLLARARSARSG
jgi:citrate lyase subunit beta / citryl-CoA lyase